MSGASNSSNNYDSKSSYRTQEKEEKSIDWLVIVVIVFVCIPFLIVLLESVCFSVQDLMDKIKQQKKDKLLEKKQDTKSKEEYDYYFSCYAFYKPEDFVNIPEGTYIENGLPCTKGPGRYGKCTVYITPKGTRYHRRELCLRSHHAKETNIVYAIRAYYPCAKCTKDAPNLEWYFEYERIKNIKKKYNIP